MEFSVGDKVMYPSRGAGKVTGMEHQELVDGFEHYYVIEIPGDRLTVRVPMRKTEDLGIRPVMSEAKLGRVLNVLGSKPLRLPKDYKERQGRIEEKLKTGRALLLAEVIRDLTARERLAYLTKRDGDLLTQGRDLLTSEIAMATDRETSDVNETIDAVLLAAPAESEPHTA
ncbi:MAG: hypothetical protein H8D78_03370 [Chloroflexi bacterium]|nr:hypothetical protein [Chloroflexota bacterium]